MNLVTKWTVDLSGNTPQLQSRGPNYQQIGHSKEAVARMAVWIWLCDVSTSYNLHLSANMSTSFGSIAPACGGHKQRQAGGGCDEVNANSDFPQIPPNAWGFPLSPPRQWPQMLQEGHRTGHTLSASFTLSSAGGLATSSIEVPGSGNWYRSRN